MATAAGIVSHAQLASAKRGSAFVVLPGRGTDRISAPETIMHAFASPEARRR
jgi:hypothetical protein